MPSRNAFTERARMAWNLSKGFMSSRLSRASCYLHQEYDYSWVGAALQIPFVVICCSWLWWEYLELPPYPGLTIGLLGLAAVIMTVRVERFTKTEKVAWVLIAFALFAIESRSIIQDHAEQSRASADALDQQTVQFQAVLNQNQRVLEQTEGGDGYCWLVPLPPAPSDTRINPPWTMIVSCEDKNKLPVVDVLVMFQRALGAQTTPEEIYAKAWKGPSYHLGTLLSGGWEPTQIELRPGKYNISIFSRRRAVLEQLSFGDFDPKTQTARQTLCVYEYRGGPLLIGNKECHNPR